MQPEVRDPHYDELVAAIPDPRFVFMNHGYMDPRDDMSWVRPEDRLFQYSAALVRRLVRGVALDGARVLDVGCGRGGTASFLSRTTPVHSVVGVDLSAGNIAFCQKVHTSPNVSFLCANAQGLPFAPETFDVVTNIESSHNYPQIDVFFAEVHRVLRPQGAFCYTDNFGAAFTTPEAVRTKIANAGFEVTEMVDITNYVASGVFAASHALMRFFVGAIDRERTNERRVVDLVHFVTMKAFMLYATRKVTYCLWRAHKR